MREAAWFHREAIIVSTVKPLFYHCAIVAARSAMTLLTAGLLTIALCHLEEIGDT